LLVIDGIIIPIVACVAYETSDSWGSLNSLKLLIVACFWLWHMIVLYICLKLQSSGNQRIYWRWGFDMKQLPNWRVSQNVGTQEDPQTSESVDHFTVETTMHGDLGPPFDKKTSIFWELQRCSNW